MKTFVIFAGLMAVFAIVDANPSVSEILKVLLQHDAEMNQDKVSYCNCMHLSISIATCNN